MRILLSICIGLFNILAFHKATSLIHVKVFQFTIYYWREGVIGEQQCGNDIKCDWVNNDNMKILSESYLNFTKENLYSANDAVTIAVYNIHSWWERMKVHGPSLCDLPTDVNLAESEESRVRYHMLFGRLLYESLDYVL